MVMKAITTKELFDLLDKENLTYEQIYEENISFLEGRINFHIGRENGVIDDYSREVLGLAHQYQTHRSEIRNIKPLV